MPDFTGFVGPAYAAGSLTQDAQECINWHLEADPTKPAEARGQQALYPTPGLLLKITSGLAAEVRGLYVVPGGATMLMVVGNTLYSVNSGMVASSAGTLSSSTGQVSITDNRVAAYIVDGANRYTYNLSTFVFATVAGADGAFTGGDRCDYCDGFIVYNSPGSNQWAATSAL